MVFSSTIFVFGFLPIVLLGTVIFKKYIRIQNVFLLCMSLLFYAWGEPRYVLLMMLSIFINWLLALAIDAIGNRNNWRNIFLIVALVFNLGILFVFKYLAWSVRILNGVLPGSVPLLNVTLPIGISFYTFQSISYVVDVWRNEVPAQKNIVGVGMYISLFPQLIAGPIVRYGDIEPQISNRALTLDGFSKGITRFLTGFIKKVLLADSVAVIADKTFSLNAMNELGGAFAWIGAIAYTFQIFFDFSGYSDMAIGLGKMLGFSFPENFNYPYRAYSVRDFWHRWHMSLSGWFRDYVYIPLGGSRKGRKRTYLNLMIVWLLTGIWHGANITFVCWGLLYGFLIIFERITNVEKKIKRSTIFRIGYRVFTGVSVIILWVIFRAESIRQAGAYIFRMFDLSKWLDDLPITYLYITEFKWELLGCIMLSIIKLPESLLEKCRAFDTVKMILLYILFIVSISYLVKGTYSPFIYFNF